MTRGVSQQLRVSARTHMQNQKIPHLNCFKQECFTLTFQHKHYFLEIGHQHQVK